MKTTISAIRTVYNYLVSIDTKGLTGITGKVYWLNQPKNSTKEDIVVRSVAMNAEAMQEGVVNVNIHMPNLVLNNDDTQPNFVRFETIAAVLVETLADVWGTDYNFHIEEPGTIVPDGDRWFCNIRLRFYTIRQ